MKIDIIIPVAGAGQRMKINKPKCTIKLKDDTSIIQRQISILKNRFRGSKIILVGGYRIDLLKNEVSRFKDITILNNKNFLTTNVAASIRMGLSKSKADGIFVVYGDLVYESKIFSGINTKTSFIIIERDQDLEKHDVGCVSMNNNVVNMMWSLPNKWCQIVYFTGKELTLLKQIAINNRGFGYEIINQIIEAGGNFAKLTAGGKVTDVDYKRHVKKANSIL